VGGVALLCALPVLASALPVSVPRLTAVQLRARILASQRMSFAGYAESNATFGLPPLPAFSSVSDLLNGVTRMRVWQASPDRWRVDVITDAAERDTYQLGPQQQYIWDSNQQSLTEVFGKTLFRLPRAADLVPSALAVRLINEAGNGAKLSLLPPRRVAGQAAAGLELAPTDPASTIGQVDIWANPGNGLPLLVDIISRGATHPALETEFFSVGPWHPDGGILTPRRGPGTSFSVAGADNLNGALSDLFPFPLPPVLAGRSRRSMPWPGLGLYGNGLAAYVVLAFSGETGLGLLSDAKAAGAATLYAPDASAVLAGAPLINLIIIHANGSPQTFLLAGLVSQQLLKQAAAELIGQ
jgi:hypothetical protein